MTVEKLRRVENQDRLGPLADDFYAALLEAHAGLTEEESSAFDARLVLVLANVVGDLPTLLDALALAQPRHPATTP